MLQLKYELISEIMRHGLDSNGRDVVDPSTNEALRAAGVALVTGYIEQLSMLELVRDPQPLLGTNGGMWIGYRLTDSGRQAASSEAGLRRAVAKLIGGPQSEVSEAVTSLLAECRGAPISEAYRDDFLKTVEEIGICFDNDCLIAVMCLSGKVLEVCVKEVLQRHEVQFDGNQMIGSLIRTVQERVPDQYLDAALNNIANVVNVSRITAVHARERIPVPSRDQAIMVIFAVRDIVRRNIIDPEPLGA
jgi:hypothetical protein